MQECALIEKSLDARQSEEIAHFQGFRRMREYICRKRQRVLTVVCKTNSMIKELTQGTQ